MSDLMPRSVAVSLIHEQLEGDKRPIPDKRGPRGGKRDGPGTHHYGMCELRALMDAIYGGPPTCEEEKVR